MSVKRFWRSDCKAKCMHEKPELELIMHGQQGDQAAITELFDRHYSSSLRLARGLLHSEDESQDAVQVAYFSAFQHLHNFRGEACFKTWITRIVVNCCLMQLRDARRRATWVNLEDLGGGPATDVLTSQAPTPEKATWYQEIGSAFSDAVSKLPTHLREVYSLYAVSGLSMKEVAVTLGLSLAATKTRLFRARAGVRSRLRRMWPDAHGRGVAAHSRMRRA
jgi:RNA polymerase sigma-70 factor, ECF subfamily